MGIGGLVSVGATRGSGAWSRLPPAMPRTVEPVRRRIDRFFGDFEKNPGLRIHLRFPDRRSGKRECVSTHDPEVTRVLETS